MSAASSSSGDDFAVLSASLPCGPFTPVEEDERTAVLLGGGRTAVEDVEEGETEDEAEVAAAPEDADETELLIAGAALEEGEDDVMDGTTELLDDTAALDDTTALDDNTADEDETTAGAEDELEEAPEGGVVAAAKRFATCTSDSGTL